METECRAQGLKFQGLDSRVVVGDFDGGAISSDGGGLLLREVEKRLHIIERFASCFTDHRDANLIEHTVEDLVAQRVYALALGYEDLNDHDLLRTDPLLATLVGKKDPSGQDRARERDRHKALAGKSTLNRLELGGPALDPSNRYRKIVADMEKIDRFLIDVFLSMHEQVPERIVLDLDATDDRIHGGQAGRFFHGYYGDYCFLPLYIFCGDHLLCARLRSSNIDASEGSVAELERIVAQIRKRWPRVAIVIRGDSGFCREAIMAWCEANAVGFVLGLAKNARLKEILGPELAQARGLYDETKRASRVFKAFLYQTRESWSRERRVVGKAEHLEKGSNPRFVVTSIAAEEMDARHLYEREYCARGEMENRIKEQQLDLFSDRTSTHEMRSNQLRLLFSSVAYTLVNALRHCGLRGTAMERAQCGTIREKLFKIGAQVKLSVRRVLVSFSSAWPFREMFAAALRNIRTLIAHPLPPPHVPQIC